jgi:hypothetical protein
MTALQEAEMWLELAGVSVRIAWVDVVADVIWGAVDVSGEVAQIVLRDNSTSVDCVLREAEWKAEEQVLLFLAPQTQVLVATASVMRLVERVSVVRAYSVLVLMTSVQRFFLLSVLLALLVRQMVLLGVLLGSATNPIYQRDTAEW